MAMKIKVVVFWTVTLCSHEVGYQCFRGLCCLNLQVEDGFIIMYKVKKTN